MLTRLLSVGLSLLLLTGCGHAALLPASSPTPRVSAADYSGSYLALTFEPSPQVADTASRLRQQLGFVDLSHAIPPRKGDELHVTVGYFKKLAPHQAEKLAQRFRGQDAYLYLDGYGVANRQVAYFTVRGCEESRTALDGLGIAYSGDDPHVTFGVNPGNPRDVHGVPKKLQTSISAHKLLAYYHLKQGSRNLW